MSKLRRKLRMVRRIFRLVGLNLRVSFQQELTHRADFVVRGGLTLLGTLGTLGVLAAVFANIDRLAGWSYNEAVVLVGFYLVVNGLLEAFVEPNLTWFAGERVMRGGLDDLLVKPVPSIFLATLGVCRPWELTDVGIGLVVATVGLVNLPATLSPQNVMAASSLLLVGLIVTWSSRLLLAVVAFWSPGLELTVLYSGLWQTGRYPLDVYPRPVRAILTYCIPVAFVAAFPTRTLVRGVQLSIMLGGLVAAAGAITLAASAWRAGLRRYTSATS